jgi:myo-inositol-1(or 4)-monophosphatase
MLHICPAHNGMGMTVPWRVWRRVMEKSVRGYLDFAVDTVFSAGRLTLGYFQNGARVDRKADASPVTIADYKAEEFIRAAIARQFPDHGIVGEEYGVKESAGCSHRWFVDPIDGTKSFTHGVPVYAVLLGLEIEGRIEVGCAYYPALDEMLAAGSGEGCWWNGRRAHVSNVARLAEGLVAFTDVADFAAYNRASEWERIKRATLHRAGWGDAYGYLLVATGRAELMLDPIVEPWDCAPFPVILREAGGFFGDWQGNWTIDAREAMATSEKLLPEVLSLLRSNGPVVQR